MTLRGRSLPGRRLRDDVRSAMRARAGAGPARGDRGEEGFILLESVVAVSLIAVLLAALGGFTLNAVSATNQLRARQAATHIATSAMAAVAAVPATDLVTGRYQASVDPVWNAAPTSVAPWLTDMERAYDIITTGRTSTIPITAQTQTLNKVAYTVTTYIGTCRASSSSSDCVKPPVGAGVEQVRAVVAVTWTGRACSTGTRAANNPCSYVTASLVNRDPDPVFNTNRAVPPVRPVVTPPGNQVSTVGATVALQLEVDDNTGVPPLTWTKTGTLPTPLTLSTSGLVTGVPDTPVSNTPLTVTVTDAFGRTGSASFTWTVVPKPTITTPAAQTTPQGAAVNLATASTCPHTPCRFTMAGAPAGLTINANTGVITGSPTTVGSSPAVTVTITDADNVTATTAAFTWTVTAGATIGNPAPLNATVSSVKNRAITYTCPTATCALTLFGTVPGMGLTTNSALATNNTATTLSVNNGSGTVYIAGAIQTTAVTSPATTKDYAPTVRITSGATNVTSAAGDWTVFAKATTAAVGTRTVKVAAATNVPITYVCPNAPCTIKLTSALIPGLGLSTDPNNTASNTTAQLTVASTSGTVYINGTVGATAVTTGTTKTWTVTLTITDADVITTSSTGTWTASKAPSLTNPGSQAIEPNQTLSLQMATTCPNNGCTWQAAAQVGADPTWYPITISTTGRITYSNAPAGAYTLRVIVTDSLGMNDTVTFPLTVQNFTFAIPNQTTTRPASGTKVVTLDISDFVSPLADGYSYTATGLPSWLSLSNNGTFTASITSSSASSGTITVTATSRASSTSTVVDTLTWTLS